MSKIDKIIAEEIDKAINVGENDEEKLRSNNKFRRGIYELTSNGKTIEPLGFEAVASESRIPWF